MASSSHQGPPEGSSTPDELVRKFLRGQNLEQIGDQDGAVDLYEQVVQGRFDSAGPYDRLLAIYSEQGRHQDIIRIAQASLEQVHTHEEKRRWYQARIEEAEDAIDSGPQPR